MELDEDETDDLKACFEKELSEVMTHLKEGYDAGFNDTYRNAFDALIKLCMHLIGQYSKKGEEEEKQEDEDDEKNDENDVEYGGDSSDGEDANVVVQDNAKHSTPTSSLITGGRGAKRNLSSVTKRKNTQKRGKSRRVHESIVSPVRESPPRDATIAKRRATKSLNNRNKKKSFTNDNSVDGDDSNDITKKLFRP